jgi:hypothetical protein
LLADGRFSSRTYSRRILQVHERLCLDNMVGFDSARCCAPIPAGAILAGERAGSLPLSSVHQGGSGPNHSATALDANANHMTKPRNIGVVYADQNRMFQAFVLLCRSYSPMYLRSSPPLPKAAALTSDLHQPEISDFILSCIEEQGET